MAAYTVVKLDYKGAYDSNYQYQTYTDEQSAQIKAQADAVVEALAGGSSLEDAAKAAGTTATTGTYATYVDPDAEKTDDSDKKSDDTESTESVSDTESKESSESSNSKTKDSVYTTNNLDQSVVDALNSLEEGQTSDLITTDSTYYIVRLDKRPMRKQQSQTGRL